MADQQDATGSELPEGGSDPGRSLFEENWKTDRTWMLESLREIKGGVRDLIRNSWKKKVLSGVIAVVVLAIGAFAWRVDYRFDTQKGNGDITRALLCQTIVLDNDRTFEVDPVCSSPAIVALYPDGFCKAVPEVCRAGGRGTP